MKTRFLICAILFSTCGLDAQINLVPNPSFELYDTCPDLNGCPVYDATGWQSFQLTPDYFNSCATTASGCSVPMNIVNCPASDGNAYAGFYSYSKWNSPNNTREYLATQLISPLSIGTKYYVSIKVRLAVTGNSLPNCATNNLGVRFTMSPYSPYLTPSPLTDNSAHIFSSTIVQDTSTWAVIQGSFIADSAYQFFVTGNFFSDAVTDTLIYHPFFGDTVCHAYYFVDDVCVSTDSMLCGLTEIGEVSAEQRVEVYPNPVSNSTTVFIENVSDYSSISVELFDIQGKKQELAYSVFDDNLRVRIPLDLSKLPQGMYLLIIQWDDSSIAKKIIHK